MTDLDLGLVLPATSAVPFPEQSSIVEHAEAAGITAAFVTESWGSEAFTRLGAFAQQTDRIDLGTGIVPVHSRSPTLLAQAVATLDTITDGRAVLGLGLSSPRVIEAWHGVEFEPALRRQRETIEVIRRVLTGEPVEYGGTVFSLSHFQLRFDPPRRSIPIYVAAQGPTNCELTGGFADGWLPNRIPHPSLPDARAYVDAGATHHGRDPDDIKTIPFVTTCILDDHEQARRRCREVIAFYIGAMGSFHYNALARHGYHATADTIRAYWDAGEHEAARNAVTDDLLDAIAITGTPSQVRTTLEAYADIADMVVLNPPTTATAPEIRETITHVASHYATE